MLWTPQNRWEKQESSVSAPAGALGTSLTPGNNTKGTWAQLISSTTNDSYGVIVHINSGFTAAAARSMLVDIGTGAAASEVVLIPDLLCEGADATERGAVTFFFPLFIPASTRIAARASVNNATVGTIRANVTLLQKPSRPELIRFGTFVRAFGVTAATSKGTTVTPGASGAEGSWTQVGSATAEDLWFWQAAFGYDDSTQTSQPHFLDLAHGDGTTKRIIYENCIVGKNSSEGTFKDSTMQILRGYCEVPSGQNIYMRMSLSSATTDTSPNGIAYGVGG